MKYIAHRRFKGISVNGKQINIPRGTECELKNNIIYKDGKPICSKSSENGHKYFTCNDDGNGLKRGDITYSIAYKESKNEGFRFTEAQRELISSKYKRFLREEHDYILFNDDFFNAYIEELREMKGDLENV